MDKYYRVFADETDGVIHAVWLPGGVCGLEEARALDAEAQTLGQGDIRLLVDLRHLDSIDRPAREFFMDLSNDRAVALVAASAPTRMLANVFLGLKRGPIPIKMFTAEPEAVVWLRSQP